MNWKTTILGALGAIWVVAEPIVTNGDFDLSRDWKSLVFATIIAAFGYFAKDKNVTGGTTPQGIIGGSTPPPNKDEK